MPVGPGKYDDDCTAILIKHRADGVILAVIGGNLGNGFSVNITSQALARCLPQLLRQMADEIERCE